MPEPQKQPLNPDPKNPDPTGNEKGIDIANLTAKQYLAALKKLKEDSVPKSVYDHLKAEHDDLVEGMMENKKQQFDVDTSKPQETVKSIDLVKKIILDKNMTNLEGWKTALQLREMKLKEGKPDIFAPLGHDRATTNAELERAERVAKTIQGCIDECNDDPVVFNNLLRMKIR